jgi:purine-cytosine permease-like protein
MTTALFMLGGITVIVGIIALLDWLARRKDRQSEHRRSA